MATSSGFKGVCRVDYEKRNQFGWSVRVRFKGENFAKFFSDGSYGGREAALTAAVHWRDETERSIGKPRTDRVINAAIVKSNTGVMGVQFVNIGPQGAFEATWSPEPGKVSRTKVSIAKYGEYEAFERACRIRRAYEKKTFGGVLGATRPAQSWVNEDISDEADA
ncbi:AP2 domain-containing protein [Abditibacterium utsteinense]|uniref:AP2 domain-containing protein n=1 Tax=Abditibacterium utsteinense TaxID=1960156 RepID=A0A2S8STC6_9BACT|nr:AP2 domain-containing protein [Abditibacterium utsteinense]PQV64047.1 AP2 domain-containing protein [Abditibacterium utsteinense]